MDRNAFLAFALSFLVLTVWMAYEAKHRPKRVPPAPPTAAQEAPPKAEPVPPTAPVRQAAPAPRPATAPEERLLVETDLYHAELTSHGGTLVRWELRRYFASRREGGKPIELTRFEAGALGALATPFTELGLGDLSQAPFRVVERAPHAVVFEYAARDVVVRKAFAFEPGSYLVRVTVEVENRTGGPVEPQFSLLWPARVSEGADFQDSALVAFHDGDLEQVPLASFGMGGITSALLGSEPEGERVLGGEIDWAGMQTRYFLAVVLPDVPRDTKVRLAAERPGAEAVAEISQEAYVLPAGRAVERGFRLYLGPKEPERLASAGAHLERSISLGWSWIAPLTRGFNWLLRACYALIPNYGVAIILITVMVRVITAPLAVKQMRSMKRMGELQPKLRELQQKYGDDRQRQSQEMMKLYRESGVNPLGGCLPMLLQIPVFIALYYALQSSIDLRQAPFVAWIHDLSQPETLFALPGLGIPVRLLPLLMGVSMVAQQKLTPTTMDPAQARMMMTLMPVMFTVLFYQFPSGLVLYWLVSNLLAIAQQLEINRRMNRSSA